MNRSPIRFATVFVAISAGCPAPDLPAIAGTAVQGTPTATTTRWSGLLSETADWRTVGDDRVVASSQPILRYRTPRRPTLFAFWATYCSPCFAELPLLKATHAQGRVAVVSVSLDADKTTLAAAALAHHQVRHRSIVVTKASLPKVGKRLRTGLPFALIVDRDGQVVGQHFGQLTEATLAELLRTVAP